jgi:hypothetical protein
MYGRAAEATFQSRRVHGLTVRHAPYVHDRHRLDHRVYAHCWRCAMSKADRIVRWSTALAVLGVAAIAAVASYEHACPHASPATQGSESSPSAPNGPGHKRSSPAGSGSSPCQQPPDHHEQPARQEGRPPRRGRSRCTPGHRTHSRPRKQTDMRSKSRPQHNQQPNLKAPERVRLAR